MVGLNIHTAHKLQKDNQCQKYHTQQAEEKRQ